MTALATTVLLVVLISCLCSLTEAALYSVTWTYLEKLRDSGSRAGKLLYSLRCDVGRPIAAVLTLNTIANTAGAAIAGSIAANVLGDAVTGWFAAALTMLILVFGEILPKTAGVTFCEPVALFMARPLKLLTIIFAPFIALANLLTRLVSTQKEGPVATAEDIRALARLSRRSGAIEADEEKVIGSVLSFGDKRVADIMTPRTVVFSLPESMTVAEAYALPEIWNFSRIPVYGDDNEDIVGIVLRRTIVRGFAEDEDSKRLGELMTPVHFVLENLPLDTLLKAFLQQRTHLFAVLDEYGGLAGVVSLEDVLEELIGHEIVDESDTQTDLRATARTRRKRLIHDEQEEASAAAVSRVNTEDDGHA